MVDKKFHYRWDFIGLSTDEKPTPQDNEKVVNGSTFYCSDTSKLYVFYKDQWYERKPLGEGGGGGGGTDYYPDLTGKPKVNGVELVGDKTSEQLGINVPTKTSELTNDSGFIDKDVNNLTNYTDNTALQGLLSGKQDTLTAGNNISIENNVISATGSGGNANFTLDTTNNFAVIQSQTQGISFELDDTDGVTLIASDPGTYQNTKILATQDYVNNVEFKTINNSSVKGSGNLNTGKVSADTQTNSVSIYEGADNSVQISKDGNDAIRIQGYGEDDRGATQTLFDMSLASKNYVDGKAGVNLAVGQETWYGTYTDENNVTYQVYTKTVYIPALPSTAGITTYPIGVTNMKQIISISGVTTDGFVLNAPRQTVSDNITIYQVSKSSQTFSIEVGKDRSNKSAYVTIIYAKNN